MSNSQQQLTKNCDPLLDDFNAFCDFVYTTPEHLCLELQARWNDPDLKLTVDNLFDGDVPAQFAKGMNAVFFRQIATPNHELELFIDTFKSYKLNPVIIEYSQDKFTSFNPLKKALGKLRFQEKNDAKSFAQSKCRTIIDFHKFDGHRINEVQTLWGESLVEFHHRMANEMFTNISGCLFDASDWFKKNGNAAKNYYTKYLALFLRHGVLFENFILEDFERNFVKEVFLPAFCDVIEKTGKKPLICPLLPFTNQASPYWLGYKPDLIHCIRPLKVL